MSTSVVVVGAGAAGLLTALELAPEKVRLLAREPLGEGAASAWAQGGLAAAVGGDDSAALHAADTLAAGDGLNDAAAVERITAAGAHAIETLARLGVPFDRDTEGRLALGLEAAHGRRRIVHAHGDATGRAIMEALVEAVQRAPHVELLEGVEARRLVVADGRVAGVVAAAPGGGAPLCIPAARVVMASGGTGALYRETTNPLGAIGHGLALAARAGAALADVEFVQFHPTALDVGLDPMPLVSEAVRGEGAWLVNERGERFMAGAGRAELEPRDVVARAVWRQLCAGHRVYLDARLALGTRFSARFPGIAARCRAAGIDPTREPIPVRPAAHYHMGGIAVDAQGRSTLEGLWACGEAAATGLHGANRLASNSLLEACACAQTVAASVAEAPRRPAQACWPHSLAPAPRAGVLRALMSDWVGVQREREGLLAAARDLSGLAFGASEVADPALVGLFVAVAALRREESRGAHCRTDFPAKAADAQRSLLRLADVRVIAASVLDTAPAALAQV